MSWSLITNEWRLKLLALALGVLMLGAVAFSQNPPTVKTLTIPLSYTVPPNIVLINPPPQTTVTISGLADAINKADSSTVFATVDATGVLPAAAAKLNISAKSTDARVTPQAPPPIVVRVDSLVSKSVPLTVNAPTAPGWSVSKAVALCPTTQCTAINFTGPLSWETNLTATVTFPAVIGQDVSGCTALACSKDALNQQIQLRNSNGPLDLYAVRTQPQTVVDISAVNLHVEAVAGATSSTVPLVIASPTQPPPQGYSITGITISPTTVVVSGDPAVLGRLQRITLPGVDLSKATSTTTFQVQIPYPRGLNGTVNIANVTYTISKNPQVSPSPP